MWGYSIPFWEAVFRWSTIAAFVLGGAGVTAAFISTWIGAKLGDISQNEVNLKLEAAKVEISEANARAEEARARALESRLELEKLQAPRTLSVEQQKALTEAAKTVPGQKYEGQLTNGVPDALSLWASIDKALSDAKWVRVVPSGPSAGIPAARIALYAPIGLVFNFPKDSLEIRSRCVVAVVALAKVGVRASIPMDGDAEIPHDTIRIQIGAKAL